MAFRMFYDAYFGRLSRYLLVVTSFEQRGIGAYTISMREFVARKK